MYYDAIEIGTSDFDIIGVLSGSRTLYVEPVPVYLASLESKIKELMPDIDASFERAAVYPKKDLPRLRMQEDSCRKMYYLSPETVSKYGLPSWTRGCNMLGRPHPEILEILRRCNLPESLIETKDTPLLSMTDLVCKYGISGIGVLKFDTEGLDCRLVQSALPELVAKSVPLPKILQFERFYEESKENIIETINICKNYGYTLIGADRDIIMKLSEVDIDSVNELVSESVSSDVK